MLQIVHLAADDLASEMTQYGLQIIAVIAILILGRIATGIGRGIVYALAGKSQRRRFCRFTRGLSTAPECGLKDPEPQIAVVELADLSVNLVACWGHRADYRLCALK